MTIFLGLNRVKAEEQYHLNQVIYDNYYYVQNGLPEHYGSDIQYRFSIDGKFAYCMDPKLAINTSEYFGIPFSKTIYDLETQKYLNKIIYYGYEYPNHQNFRYYMATQALIWEKISGYLIEFYTERYGHGDYVDISFEKNIILNLIGESESLPYFAGNEYNYNYTNYLEFVDSYLKNFEIVDSTWDDVSIEKNKLKIENLDGFSGTINIKLKRKNYRNDIPMYYYVNTIETQPFITGGKLDELTTEVTINIGGAQIQVDKIDKNTNKPLSGVEFSLYAKEDIVGSNGIKYYNKDQFIKKGLTNSDGIVIFDELYYL